MTGPTPAAAMRIVVGVDGSPPSRLALRWAHRIWEATGGYIQAVAAWHVPANFGWTYATEDWNPEVDAKRALQDSVEEVFPDGPPPGLELVVRQGPAAKVLVEASTGATMLVVGSRGHGGFAGLLLGSVSANCAEHANCPVLVVHGDTSPPQTHPDSAASRRPA